MAYSGLKYSEKILEHFENPRNVGILGPHDPKVGTAMVGAPSHGDIIRLQIKVSEQDVIEDVKFKAFGSVSTIAVSSLITEWLKNKTLDEARTIDNRQIAEYLSLPSLKIHCAVLAENAIQSAIEDYRSRNR